MEEDGKMLLSDQEDNQSNKESEEGEKKEQKQLNDMDILRELLQKQQDILNENKVEMIKKDFDNTQLMQRIIVLENALLKQNINEENIKKDLNLNSDVFLNYNNKQNYVDILHEKIMEMHDLLKGHNYSEKSKKHAEITYQLQILKEREQKLKKLYVQSKKKCKILSKIKQEYDEILPQAIKMRAVLKRYYEEGQMNMQALDDLYLDQENRILDVTVELDQQKTEQQNTEEQELQGSIYLQYREFTRIEVMKTLIAKTKILQKLKEDKKEELRKQIENDNRRDRQMEQIKIDHEKQLNETKDRFTKKINELTRNYRTALSKQQEIVQNAEKERSEQINQIKDNQKQIIAEKTEAKVKMEPQMQMMEKEIKSLKSKLAKYLQQIEHLKKERTEMLNKNQNKKLSEEEKKERKLSNTGQLLLNRLEYMQKNQILTKRYQDNYYRLQQEINVERNERKQLEQEVEELEKDNEKLEKENFEYVQKIGEMNGKLEIYETNTGAEDTAQFMIKINELNAQMQQKEGQIGLMEQEILYLQTIVDENEKKETDKYKVQMLEEVYNIQKKCNEQKAQIQDMQFRIEEQEQILLSHGLLEEQYSRQKLLTEEELIDILQRKRVDATEFQRYTQDKQKKIKDRDLQIKNLQEEIEILKRQNKLFLKDMQNMTESKLQVYKEQYKSQLQSMLMQQNEQSQMKKSTVFEQKKALQDLREQAIEKNIMIEEKEQQIRQQFKKINELEKDLGNVLKEFLEVKKYKKVIEDIQRNEANYIKLKSENKGLEEQIKVEKEKNKKKDIEIVQINNRYTDYEKNIQKKNKLIDELQNEIQEIKVQEMYKQMLSEAADQKIRDQQVEIQKLKKRIQEMIIKQMQQGTQVQYTKQDDIRQINEDTKYTKNNEIYIQDQLYNIQNNNNNVNIQQQKEGQIRENVTMNSITVRILEEQMQKMQTEIIKMRESEKKQKIEIVKWKEREEKMQMSKKEITEIQYKIERLRKILQSRDIEIIELIKDSNKKTEQIIQLKQISGITEEEYNKIQKNAEDKIENGKGKVYRLVKNENNEQEKDEIYIEIEKYRKKFQIEKKGKEELLQLYKRMEQNTQMLSVEELWNIEEQKRVKTLKIQKVELEEEKEKKDIEMKVLKEKIENIKKEKEEMYDKIEKLQISQRKQEIESMETKQRQLQQEFIYKEQQRELQELREKVIKQNRINIEQQKQVNELQIEKNELDNQILLIQNQQQKNKLRIEQQNGRIELLEKEVEQLQEEIIDNTEEFLHKMKIVDENKFEKIQKIEELEMKNMQLEKKYQALKKNYNSIQELEDLANLELDKKNYNFSPQAMLKFAREAKMQKDIEQKNTEIAQLKEKLMILQNNIQNKTQNRQNNEKEEDEDNITMQNSRVSEFAQVAQEKNQFLTRIRVEDKGDHELCDQQISKQAQKISLLLHKIEALEKVNSQYLGMIKDKTVTGIQKNNFMTSVQPLEIPQVKSNKKIESLKGQNQRLQDLKRELQKENYDLKRKEQKQEREIEMWKEKVEEQELQIMKMKEKIGQIELDEEEQKDQKNVQYIKMIKEKEEYYKKVIKNKDKQLEEIEILRKDRKELIEKIHIIEKQKQNIEVEIEKMQKKYELSRSKAEEYQKLYNDIKQIIKQQREEKEQLEKELLQQGQKIEQFEIEKKTKDDKNIEQQQQIEELQKKIQNRDKVIEELKEENRKNEEFYLKNQKFHEEEETKILLRKKDRRITELEKKVQRNTDLELELDTMRKGIIQHEIDNRNQQKRMNELEQEMKEKEEEMQIKEIQIEQLKKTKEQIQEQSDNRKKGQQKLQEMKEQLESKNKNLQLQMQQIIEERNFLEIENERVQEQFEIDFRNFKVTLEERIREMSFYRTQKEKKIKQLQKDNEILTFANEDLYTQIEQLKGKNVDLVIKEEEDEI